MGARESAVDVDLGVHVDAVELDPDAVVGELGLEHERLAVEAEAALEEAGARGVWNSPGN